MNKFDYWNNIYSTKSSNEVSWTQEIPETSLSLIQSCKMDLNSNIIDIGAGDSKLVDNLLEIGFSKISVLDISEVALQKAKDRLNKKSSAVKWIVEDIVNFNPNEKYDIWHDRAVFHFLTEAADIEKYVKLTTDSINANGFLILGTFSKNGPMKCSGLNITQYDKESILKLYSDNFDLLDNFQIDHQTPFNTIQNFEFFKLKRK